MADILEELAAQPAAMLEMISFLSKELTRRDAAWRTKLHEECVARDNSRNNYRVIAEQSDAAYKAMRDLWFHTMEDKFRYKAALEEIRDGWTLDGCLTADRALR